VQIVLDLLAEHDVRATFFVGGEVAREYPEVVREIVAGGHEIGSHGQTHTPLFDLTPASFEAELERSREAIEACSGVTPQGFRAPNFSVTRETSWAFEALADSGYRYDSSVFPAWTPLYGVRDAPTFPYSVDVDRPFEDPDTTTRTDLVEVPLLVLRRPLRLPLAGGFYGRLLPVEAFRYGLWRLNRRGRPGVLYFHPWEFNPEVPTGEPRLRERFVSFHGIDTLEAKLDRLLEAVSFGPIRDVLAAESLLGPTGEPSGSVDATPSEKTTKL